MRIRRQLLPGLVAIAGACGSEPPVAPPADDPIPAFVTIAPGSLTIGALGRQVVMQAVVRNAAGDTLTGVSVSWAHVSPGITSISATGVLTAMANGDDLVVATAGGVADTVPVTVAQVPAALTISAPQTTLTVLGTSLTVTAAVTDSNGRAVAGHVAIWTSRNAQALPVDSTGRVTAARLGTAAIVATSGVWRDSVVIDVAVSGPVGGPLVGAVVPCAGGSAGPFPCDGVELLSYLPIGALGGAGTVDLNDMWGWTDPVTGTEWALVMRRDGLAFVNLADPLNPVYAGFLPVPATANASFWHDVKVYADHAFVVADGAGQHGVQVFDLTQLRSVTGPPVTFTALTRYTGVASVHNIAIIEATGFAYLMGSNAGGTTCGGGLHMLDIRTPGNPVFAGCFADPLTGRGLTGYTHDAQCVVYGGPDAAHVGREICFGTNETHLSIADVTDKTAPVALARAGYPNVGYAHQGWLTADQQYFLSNDELDESMGLVAASRTLIWDVTDLDDPVLVGQYLGPNAAIDHNHYIVGNRLYASNYQFGIRVLDISDPVNPVQVGRFDTAPDEGDQPGFGGSWSNYPFFASGVIVVTSGDQGLFVLRVP